MRQVNRTPFGEPPPRYPAKVVGLRRFGDTVTGADAIGGVTGLGFDVVVRTIGGEMAFNDVASHCPRPPNGLDINPNGLVGAIVDALYIPEESAWVFLIPLLPDNIDCASIGG